MSAYMYKFMVFVYKRDKSRFPTTMLAFMLLWDKVFLIFYSEVITEIQY